jgi:Type IV leader peptidase family
VLSANKSVEFNEQKRRTPFKIIEQRLNSSLIDFQVCGKVSAASALGPSRREGMGLGDLKLAAVAGLWLGAVVLPVAMELAVLGALATHFLQHAGICRHPARLQNCRLAHSLLQHFG